jgi:hypothetical protein
LSVAVFRIPANWRELDEEIRAAGGWSSDGALSSALWRRQHPEESRQYARERYDRWRAGHPRRGRDYSSPAEVLAARHGRDFFSRISLLRWRGSRREDVA